MHYKEENYEGYNIEIELQLNHIQFDFLLAGATVFKLFLKFSMIQYYLKRGRITREKDVQLRLLLNFADKTMRDNFTATIFSI